MEKYTKMSEIIIKGDYRVEFIDTIEGYEAWIWNKNYGVKSMILGMERKDNFFMDDFEKLVIETIEDDIRLYKNQYED